VVLCSVVCVWLWKGGQEPEMVVVLGEQRLARAWAKVMLRPVPVQNKDVMIVLNLRMSDVAEKERGTNLLACPNSNYDWKPCTSG
jgi:hypothetical protein